jgi:hypothetical protein
MRRDHSPELHEAIVHLRAARVLVKKIEGLKHPKYVDLHLALIEGLGVLESHLLNLTSKPFKPVRQAG